MSRMISKSGWFFLIADFLAAGCAENSDSGLKRENNNCLTLFQGYFIYKYKYTILSINI